MWREKGDRFSGRFWLPSQESEAVGGWLDLSGRCPILDLAEPLTRSMREVSRTTQPDGSVIVQAVASTDEEFQLDGLTIHGMLRGGLRPVTLVGGITVRRRGGLGGHVRDPGEQSLRAKYALLGGYAAGEDVLFTKARLRLRHLDAWAQLPGVEVQVVEDGSRITVLYEDQEAETAEVPGLSGRLILDSTVTVSEPTVRGASVTRTAELCLEIAKGMTLDGLWRRFVAPLAALLTLAVDTDCPPVSLDVYSEHAGRWLEVRRPELKDPADGLLDVWNVLLTRFDLSVSHLAAWLDAVPALRPIPSLVAEVAIAPERTLVNQLLDMAIAAEGLHRRLQPNEQLMSLKQAEKARCQEPTYGERLHFLTDLVCVAVPGATGRTEEWEQRIKAVRNGFAHQEVPSGTTDADDDGEWQEYLVLLRTLRWVLTGALLLQTGLAPDRLAERLQQHEPYRVLVRQARHWLPHLYPPP